MRINRGIRQQLLAASLGVSLLQPIALGAVGSLLLGAAAGEVKAQQTLNTEAIGRIAQAITVRIEGATQGSGVLVKREGNRYTVLTAWHVVSGQRPGEELDVYTSDGQRHPVATGTIQRVGDVDMATLSFQSNNVYQLASIESKSSVTRGDPTIVAGFPRTKQGSILVSNGVVVANADIGIDNGYQLIYTSQTEPGMSGGPVLDSRGYVVAIHGRGELDSFISEVTSRTIKTGANQGVPIRYFMNGATDEVPNGNAREPETADDYIAQAKSLLDSETLLNPDGTRNIGISKAAIRLLSKSIDIKATWEGYSYRGVLKAEIRDVNGGLDDLINAQRLNPLDYRIAGSLFLLYRQIGQRDDAVRHLTSYLQANAQSLDSDQATELIHLLAQAGERNKALSIVNEMLGRGRTIPELLALRALIKKWNGDNLSAIADFRIASQYGFSGDYLLAEAEILDLIKESEGIMSIINYWSKMISRYPERLHSYRMRASARAELGDMKGFYDDSILGFEFSQKQALDYAYLSEAKWMIGDTSGAVKDLEVALQLLSREKEDAKAYLPSGIAEAYRYIAIVQQSRGDTKGAIDTLILAIKRLPKDASSSNSIIAGAYRDIASAQQKIGDTKGAIDTLNQAIKLFPKDTSNLSARAHLRENTLNDRKGAVEDYMTAAKRTNYEWLDVSAWAEKVAMPFYETGDNKYLRAAIDVYNDAIFHRPRESFHYLGRAKLKARIGDLLGALEDFNAVVAIDNRHHKERAEVLLALGRNDEARADLDRAIELLGAISRWDVFDIVEMLVDRLGETGKALALLTKLLNDATDKEYSSRLYSSRAAIKVAIGDAAGGCADHRRAISIDLANHQSNEWLKSNMGTTCP
jgi:tetratricopeptide (TPR) repeat protein